ncbi:hypothetical protein QQS21_002254 [Conoideocrella luteorostrata]|uniref:Uncharacterized protein n=1 Tax=Conoideocrella luteorostrata TaxID=1105319 RepID=A0AAJ0CVF1_9HYPO|nr:hypothetical protein QQS21_002254 [Conoideocrella luteorostrata]
MVLHEQQQHLINTASAADFVRNGRDYEIIPCTLKESAPSWLWRAGISVLLLIIPLAYIVLISIIFYLNGREQSSFGDNVLQILQIASTLWPISFAAVMGPFLKTLALHQAEKGSSLGSLEFLLTSQTTVAAFKNLFARRNIQTWTVGITLAWCISPLGGQAAVRSLSLRPASTSLEIPAAYYPGGNVSDLNLLFETNDGMGFPFMGASAYASRISDMRSAVVASFFGPAVVVSHSNGSSDKFSTAVEALRGTQQAARLGQRDLWRNVRVCLRQQNGGYIKSLSYPNIFFDVFNDTATITDHLSSPLYPMTEPSSKLDLIVAGYCYESPQYPVKLRKCQISTSYIDIQVACTRLSSFSELNCQAERVRHTRDLPIAGNLTALSSSYVMRGIIWEMPFTMASFHEAEPSNLETYLKDPPLLMRRYEGGFLHARPGCFENVSSEVFEARLATALNTFIMAMYSVNILAGLEGTSSENRNKMWYNSTVKWTEYTANVYVLDKAWFSIWLASTLVLFTCAVIGIIIRCIIRAPDFLDSVGGLTRDSPYMDYPQGGSGMSGSDWLQVVKKMKVRICDVQPDDNIGKIALTTDIHGSKLDWERMYS